MRLTVTLGLYYVALRAFNETNHGFPIFSCNIKVIKCGSDMPHERVPVLFVNAHARVRSLHVASRVDHRTTCDVTQEIDQKLQFALQAVLTAMRPEAAELLIRHQPPN